MVLAVGIFLKPCVWTVRPSGATVRVSAGEHTPPDACATELHGFMPCHSLVFCWWPDFHLCKSKIPFEIDLSTWSFGITLPKFFPVNTMDSPCALREGGSHEAADFVCKMSASLWAAVDPSSLLGLFRVPHCSLWGAGWRASGAHSFPPTAVFSVKRSSLNTCPLFYL